MEVLRGWADGSVLVAYLSSVDIPLGTSLVKLFGSRFGKDVDFFLLQPTSRSLILACHTLVVYNSSEKTDIVVSKLILRSMYTLSVCKSLLKCVPHSKSQELNDDLSVWSQISTRLPLVCIKSQQGGKMATPPKQKFCTNPLPLIPLPSIRCRSPQSCVPDNWASWLPPAPLHSTAPQLSLPHYHWISMRYSLKQIVIILSSLKSGTLG